MKPRTKQEKEVYALSKKLKPHKRELNKVLKRPPQDYGKIYHVIAEVVEGYQVFRYFLIVYDVHHHLHKKCVISIVYFPEIFPVGTFDFHLINKFPI